MPVRAAADAVPASAPPPVYLCSKCDRRVLVEFEDGDPVYVVIKRGACIKACREPVYRPENSIKIVH